MKFFVTKFYFVLLTVVLLAETSLAVPAATELLSLGRMTDAINLLTKRDDAESLNLLSRAYFAMEQWDEAVKYGERAVNLEPNNAVYHLWLGREYGRKAGDSNPLVAAGMARKAKNEFERAVQLEPTSVEARVDLAQYYTEAPSIMGGGLDKARQQAAEVEKYDKGKSLLVLARVSAKQKDFPQAEAQLRQAVKQAKNPADMWLHLAAFYRQRGHADGMQNAVQQALAQANKPAETYFDAARELSLGNRDFPDAVQYLQKYLASGALVEWAPAFRAHYLLGQLNEKMNHQAAAVSEYEASLSLASGFVPARQALNRTQ